jgi:hypothetical protein
MKMNRMTIALLAAGLVLAGTPVAAQLAPAVPYVSPMSKEGYEAAKKDADAQFKADKDQCATLTRNAADICLAQARGKENVAKADAKAAHENTPKAREAGRVAHAQAAYDVAKEKCDDFAGNRKDVCVKEAKAELIRGKADAKVERVVTATNIDAANRKQEARAEANADKREADYKVAVEKCDSLAGGAKESCVAGAKAQFGRT